MVRAVMDHVAALAQALEIAKPVVARVMIEMGCGQDDAGWPHLRRLLEVGPPRSAAASVAPGAARRIEPAAVRQTANRHTMGPPTSLADAVGALKPHATADLRPVPRIKPPHLRLDRHRCPRRPSSPRHPRNH